MRTNPQLGIIAFLLFSVMLCAGCASSMAERGLLPDIKARRPPAVNLSLEIILLEEANMAKGYPVTSLISTDGRAHLFTADKKKQIHHVEVSGNEVLLREILGMMEDDTRNQAMDAVEQPAGRLRVLAGDKQFIKSGSDKKWQEIKGNLCARFITAGDDLYCAFIASGKELGAPTRRDWTVGFFILLPVAFWSDVIADKLVLARESQDGWTIRAVFDPEIKLSARPDFMAGADRDGSFHFLYRASGGSRGFIVGFGGYTGVIESGPLGEPEIRYARVRQDQLFAETKKSDHRGGRRDDTSIPWVSIQGAPLAPMPYLGKYWRPVAMRVFGSLERQFAVNHTLGDILGLMWVGDWGADDGTHQIGPLDQPWINVKIREGQWAPHFEIVTARDLPEPGWRWLNDQGALIRNDSKGNNHLLFIRLKPGFWSAANEMCYLFNAGDDWSAPLILESNLGSSRRSIAVDETGKVFVAWENASKSVVGRWIFTSP